MRIDNRAICGSIRGVIALLFCMFSALSATTPYYWVLPPIDETHLEGYRHLPFAERRAATVAQLRDYAENTQSDALRLLGRLAEEGFVENVRPLWICDVIRFDAEPQAIAEIEGAGLGGYLRPSIGKEALLFDPRSRPDVEPTADSIAWGVERIGAPAIWRDYGVDGSGVLVALLDSGVDFGNPNLEGALWQNPHEIPFNGVDDDSDGYIDDWRGYDFSEDDPWPHDEHGHGTHVAGTIAGRGIMGLATGVAPGCKILPLKVLDSAGMGEEADVWEAIQYAVEAGARVMNLSIGWRYSSDPDRATWRAAVDAACAAGVAMCIAGGNEGGSPGAPENLRTPGDVPRALTVGASTILDDIASFSSVGPVSWSSIAGYGDFPYPPGLLKPDVVAPGDSVPSSIIGGSIAFWDGTSMACPHISGAAALLVQFAPDIDHDSIKAILEDSAVDLGLAGKDSVFGSGRIDLPTAFDLIGEIGYIAGTTEPSAEIVCDPSGANVVADSIGNYLISLPAGTYNITADKFGYEPNLAVVGVFAGDTTHRNLPLSMGIPVAMRFAVRDFDSGDPIDSVGIVLSDWSPETLYTDDLGMLTTAIAESEPAIAWAVKAGYTSDFDSLNIEYPDTMLHRFYLHRAMDFEADSVLGHFGTSSSGSDDWEWGEPSLGPTARSGRKLWATRLDTTYSNSTDSWLRLGEMDLSADEVEAPMAVFWQWFELEATSHGCWDGGNIAASLDGILWNIVEPEGGYPIFLDDYNDFTGGQPGFSGEFCGMSWREVRFPLDDYIGDTVQLAVHMGSDDNTVFRGWFIDDAALLPATSRAPIFRWANADFDTFSVAVSGTLYVVSDPIDSVVAHFSGAAAGSMELERRGEYFHGEIPGPYIEDTLFIWLSAKDIAGRSAFYPAGAPDSVLAILVGGASIDTMPPAIRRWAYWPRRSSSLDSARLRFIVTDESPFAAELRYSCGLAEDTLAPTAIFGDTLSFILPAASDEIDWCLSAWDTLGNAAADSGAIAFAPSFALDFALSRGPVEPEDGSPWRWAPDSGWLFAGEGLASSRLPIPLWECPAGSTVVEIEGAYAFAGDAAGVLVIGGTMPDSIAALPDSVPPGNPFFAGSPGIISSGTTAAAIVAVPSPAILVLTPTVAGAAGDSAFWCISSISFQRTTSILENRLPIAASMSVKPNPFNGSCRISFSNPMDAPATVEIFDIAGKAVWTARIESGKSAIVWNGRTTDGKRLPSGVYLIRIDGFAETIKAVYLR